MVRSMLGLISNGFLQPPRAEDMYYDDLIAYDVLAGMYLEDVQKQMRKGR